MFQTVKMNICQVDGEKSEFCVPAFYEFFHKGFKGVVICVSEKNPLKLIELLQLYYEKAKIHVCLWKSESGPNAWFLRTVWVIFNSDLQNQICLW